MVCQSLSRQALLSTLKLQPDPRAAEPVSRKPFKLDELLRGIAGHNLHKPVDTGAPVGKEVW